MPMSRNSTATTHYHGEEYSAVKLDAVSNVAASRIVETYTAGIEPIIKPKME